MSLFKVEDDVDLERARRVNELAEPLWNARRSEVTIQEKLAAPYVTEPAKRISDLVDRIVTIEAKLDQPDLSAEERTGLLAQKSQMESDLSITEKATERKAVILARIWLRVGNQVVRNTASAELTSGAGILPGVPEKPPLTAEALGRLLSGDRP